MIGVVARSRAARPEMTYDLVVVGTGFASSFFLLEYLARAPRTARVLVVERGWRESRAWQLAERKVSRIPSEQTFRRQGLPEKRWMFTLAFGGGSNCWLGCTPRFLPNDFRLRTTYGVGDDWPLSYEDLQPYYERAESIMAISGASGGWPYPRHRPYPQPPHRLSVPDQRLAAAYPGLFIPQPTARARIPTRRRTACCANGTCGLCPIDAKFTIENELAWLYDDPRVTVRLGCEVRAVEIAAGRATGVVAARADGPVTWRGDLVVLGSGAIFNAAILLRSGLPHRLLGRRLFEQLSVGASVDLAGLDNFQGSTKYSGHGYMLYDGAHRARHAACLIETDNMPGQLRWERGRERQLMHVKFILEDLPQDRNGITLDEHDVPVLRFEGYTDYARRGIEAASARLPSLLAPLPVERVAFNPQPSVTEGHILGTVVMGKDPERSIVDPWMVHHRVRNLVVLGGSAFPTGSPANPTLTISALALWSADHLLS